MNKSELIEALKESIENYGDGEVRLATQENWPFEHDIQGVVEGRELTDDGDEERPELEDLEINDLEEIAIRAGQTLPSEGHPDATRKKILMASLRNNPETENWMVEHFGEPENSAYHDIFYIIEGTQLGYFTKDAWNH